MSINKPKKYYASFAVAQTPYCCGFLECGNMHIKEWTSYNNQADYPSYKFSDDKESLAAEVLDDVRKVDKKVVRRPVMFNFKKLPMSANFEAYELLDLISKEPDFQVLAEYTNPNTGNTIRSCILMNGAKVAERKS